MQKNKIMVIGALACALSGFFLGLLEVEQKAEAALLPNPPEPVIEQPAAEPEPVKLYTGVDVDMLARLIYTEARGVQSRTEQAAVVWCVLNRLDNPNRPQNTIAEVVTAPYQFAYRADAPVTAEFRALAKDVLDRWQAEKNDAANIGRVLPREYHYFEGWGGRNWFSVEWRSDEYWDWELDSPYED